MGSSSRNGVPQWYWRTMRFAQYTGLATGIFAVFIVTINNVITLTTLTLPVTMLATFGFLVLALARSEQQTMLTAPTLFQLVECIMWISCLFWIPIFADLIRESIDTNSVLDSGSLATAQGCWKQHTDGTQSSSSYLECRGVIEDRSRFSEEHLVIVYGSDRGKTILGFIWFFVLLMIIDCGLTAGLLFRMRKTLQQSNINMDQMVRASALGGASRAVAVKTVIIEEALSKGFKSDD